MTKYWINKPLTTIEKRMMVLALVLGIFSSIG